MTLCYNGHMAIIYKATGPNGKRYIGVTKRDLRSRISQHKYCAFTRQILCPLYEDMRSFGFDKFVFETLETCDDSKMFEKEKFWIKTLKTFPNEYNQSAGGRGCNKFTLSQDRKDAIGKSLKKLWADPKFRKKIMKGKMPSLQDSEMQSIKGILGGYAKAEKQPLFKVTERSSGKLLGIFRTKRAFAEVIGATESTAGRYMSGKLKKGTRLYMVEWIGG